MDDDSLDYILGFADGFIFSRLFLIAVAAAAFTLGVLLGGVL